VMPELDESRRARRRRPTSQSHRHERSCTGLPSHHRSLVVPICDVAPCIVPVRGSPLRDIRAADSSDGRDKLAKSLRWSIPLKGLARALVEQGGDLIEVGLGVDREVGPLGEELSDEAIPVFVGASLPGLTGEVENCLTLLRCVLDVTVPLDLGELAPR
jgi:hypothetical protein